MYLSRFSTFIFIVLLVISSSSLPCMAFDLSDTLRSTGSTIAVKDSVKLVDSKLVISNKKKSYKIIPRVATLHSLMIPGWGQIYNKQYWKLPLVVGAFVTLGLIANYNHTRYMKYRDYYYIVSPRANDPTYVPPSTVAVPYEDGVIRDLDVNQLKRINDGFRRNRDYTYIGIVVAWAFNVIDANVSAHLKTFDVSDDISLKIKPVLDFNPVNNSLVSGLTLSFNFKK
jgi:hypothetical protein